MSMDFQLNAFPCPMLRELRQLITRPGLWKIQFRISNIGCVSQGVKETPGPSTVVHPPAPGPLGHPHQFSVASTVPVPMLSTPISPQSKLFRCIFTWPGVLVAMSTVSPSITFPEITVPVIEATPKMLIPVGPVVGSKESLRDPFLGLARTIFDLLKT